MIKSLYLDKKLAYTYTDGRKAEVCKLFTVYCQNNKISNVTRSYVTPFVTTAIKNETNFNFCNL